MGDTFSSVETHVFFDSTYFPLCCSVPDKDLISIQYALCPLASYSCPNKAVQSKVQKKIKLVSGLFFHNFWLLQWNNQVTYQDQKNVIRCII